MTNKTWLVTIISILIIIALGTVEASPMRYYGTPVFYSNMMPTQVVCAYDKNARYGVCGYQEGDVRGMVGYTRTDTEDLLGEGTRIPLFTEVICVKGECKSNYNEPMGKISIKETSYWSIPKGYYLVNSDKHIVAFKHGNGPLAKEYPIRDVLIVPKYGKPDGYYIPEEQTRLTFNVFCNDGNECSYMGKVIKYANLNKYVPKRLSHICDQRFCYDDKQLIIGLNPKYK